MTQTMQVGDVVEAYIGLAEDDQDDAFEKIKTLRIEAGRARIQAAMDEARRERAEGKTKAMTPEEIMNEARS
jgi:hypothetical protein